MADFTPNDRVRIAVDHPATGVSHRIPRLDVDLTGDGDVYDGTTAQAILDALPHTFVGPDDLSVEVVKSANVDATSAAEELASDHDIDLAELNGTGADGRILKSDVQAEIDEQTAD
jgi:pyridoxal/pyridoxine/pyridoxamine kinase